METDRESRRQNFYANKSEYIRRMSLDGKIVNLEMSNVTPVVNALRIIGNNINQIAKKANETNSIHTDDLENIKNFQEEICRTLSLYLSAVQSTAA